MKPFKHLPSIAPFFFLPVLLFSRNKAGRMIICLLLVITVAGCFQFYYRTNSQRTVDASTVQQLQAAHKYFIVHFRDSIVALDNLSLGNDRIQATAVPLLPEHSMYLDPGKSIAGSRDTFSLPTRPYYRVKASQRKNALMEVHLYTAERFRPEQAALSLPLSSFRRIDVYELDKGATRGNHILSTVGVILGVGSAALLIAYAITCNCPQVCVKDAGDYHFVSGVYSGAIYSSLERTDYLPLRTIHMTGDKFSFRIKNVNDEEQFINRMQLLRVDHAADVQVLVDRHGKVLSYKQPQPPARAMVDKKTDIAQQLYTTDDDQYLFDNERDENGFSNIVLTFRKPVDTKKAKLVVHGGNTLWSGYLYHTFAAMFGSSYEKWRNEKDKSNPAEMEQWQMDQALPLIVYVEKNGKWEFADYFTHTGNTASRDMIMELDVSTVNTRQVKIKLETAYQFWNLDYAGIDYSENANASSTMLDALAPINAAQTAKIESVKMMDQDYCRLKPNEQIDLDYSVTASPQNMSSYFFVSTGYYHNIKKYDGEPQTSALLKFKQKGAFDEFSRQKFEEVRNSLAQAH